MRFTRYRLLFLAVAVLAAAPPSRAAELFLADEREIYLALDKLNAMGALPGFLANTLPYDMKAVRTALDNNPAVLESSNCASQLARWVALYSKDAATLRGTASLSWSGNGADQDTNDGVPTPEAFSGGLSALGRWDPLPYLSGHAKGVAWSPSALDHLLLRPAGPRGRQAGHLGDSAWRTISPRSHGQRRSAGHGHA